MSFSGFSNPRHLPTRTHTGHTSSELVHWSLLFHNLDSDLLCDLSVNFGWSSKMVKITKFSFREKFLSGEKNFWGEIFFFVFWFSGHFWPNQKKKIFEWNFFLSGLHLCFLKMTHRPTLKIWPKPPPIWLTRLPSAYIWPQIGFGTFLWILVTFQKWQKSHNFTFGVKNF